MNWNLKKTILIAFTRVLTLYLIVFAVLSVTVDLKKVFRKAGFRTLNRLKPESLASIKDITADRKNINRKELRAFELYFEKVAELLPDMADAQGMVGFSSYYLGKTKQAIRAYEKAIVINPSFFWFYYNLGMIYFKDGQYGQAVKYFESALASKPEMVSMFISSSSRVYLPIINDLSHAQQMVNQQAKQGYHNAQLLLVVSQFRLKNYDQMLQNAISAVQSGLDSKGLFAYFAGLACYEKKDYQRAGPFFEQTVKMNPQFPEAIEYFGLTIKVLGQEQVGQGLVEKAKFLKEKIPSPLQEIDSLELEIY